ncbi:molybdopterin molybdotransferase MoeA [Novosphingobium guangzhouense]|uniref:molybdopterin molybdotransferase MoeA n=1 Tax=Novosphingobium guangzhouense TaxID=1850347 RepID=UPI000CCC58E9|nr:molybdopterin molybdotransferase MoeA [Novosphingobium guangzhouense]
MTASPPLKLEDAQRQLLELVTPLPAEQVEILAALNRYVARPLLARRTQPSADLSAMDGYAVSAGDLQGPWQLIGESAAGHPYHGHITPGQAIRISTGAALPEDAFAVILQEDITADAGLLSLSGDPPSPPRKHIRPRGMDFTTNTEIISAGNPLTPARIALAIAAGHSHVPVHRAPRLTVIDSGDELATDLADCAAYCTPASNGPMLLAMAHSLCAATQRIGPVPDNIDAIISALDTANDADIIVTSGGASVGDHDLIRPALERWGARIDFWRVAIKPGKPILVATRSQAGRQQIILGLPGNPVSSYVTAYHFLLPVLRAMQGALCASPLPLSARLSMPLPPSGRRREFLRGWWDGKTVNAAKLQDSGALSSLASSNVLIDRPAMAPAARTGDEVDIFLLQNGGIA